MADHGREAQRDQREALAVHELATAPDEPLPWSVVEDDLLRLVFTCCHPALAPAARVALLALLLSAHARSHGRVDELGQPRLLADADRTRWDQGAITEAVTLTGQALRAGAPGPYQLQAAISCLHSVAPSVEATDWPQIVELYDLLLARLPTLAVRVNRAVAVAQVDGPAAGLALLDALREERGAQTWHLFHAVRADLLRRLGEKAQAAAAYRQALACEPNGVDRRFLEARLVEVG